VPLFNIPTSTLDFNTATEPESTCPKIDTRAVALFSCSKEILKSHRGFPVGAKEAVCREKQEGKAGLRREGLYGRGIRTGGGWENTSASGWEARPVTRIGTLYIELILM
jgi:hypothetical protein